MNENKTTYSGSDVLALFSKLEKRLESLTCFVRDCCAKVPINIGRGLGLYRRLSSGEWQFKTLLAGDNITLTETTEEIVISASSSTPSCQDINNCLGISESGSDNKFLNEQGDFISISRFTCSDLNTCSTSNLQEGSRLYFTDNRAISALTGQNISLFTNNVGYLTSSSLTPYLTISSASSTYYPITNPNNYLSSISSLDVTTALGYTPYNSTNPSGFITSSSLTPYLLSSTAASTYEPIITPGTTSQWRRGDNTWQTIDKSTIGSGNVDNTSDANKPISTATQNASEAISISYVSLFNSNSFIINYLFVNSKTLIISSSVNLLPYSNLQFLICQYIPVPYLFVFLHLDTYSFNIFLFIIL